MFDEQPSNTGIASQAMARFIETVGERVAAAEGVELTAYERVFDLRRFLAALDIDSSQDMTQQRRAVREIFDYYPLSFETVRCYIGRKFSWRLDYYDVQLLTWGGKLIEDPRWTWAGDRKKWIGYSAPSDNRGADEVGGTNIDSRDPVKVFPPPMWPIDEATSLPTCEYLRNTLLNRQHDVWHADPLVLAEFAEQFTVLSAQLTPVLGEDVTLLRRPVVDPDHLLNSGEVKQRLGLTSGSDGVAEVG